MSATDELRRLLNERGIVWMDVRRPTFLRTCWKTGDADVYCYFDEEKSTGVFGLSISGYDFTPEQVIAATLGRGTCEWVLEHSGTLYDKWRCSNCGYLFVESRVDQGIKDDFDPNYCPNCGRAVKR